jgi:prephenate dehydrogenase
MDLLVVGAGAMGRWLGDALDAAAFADADPAVAEAAAAAAGDARAVSLDGAETFAAVAVATPMTAAPEVVTAQADRAERALLDVAGVMGPPVDAMRAAAPDRERLSLHPLFAPANAPGNVAVVHDAPGPVTDAVRERLAATNHLFDTTPAEHDAAMETVQAAAHAAVLAYALAAEEVRPEFVTPVSGRLAALVDGVAGGGARVYREIQSTFDGADRVAAAARRIADADAEAFDRLYAEAAATDLPRAPERGDDHERGAEP